MPRRSAAAAATVKVSASSSSTRSDSQKEPRDGQCKSRQSEGSVISPTHTVKSSPGLSSPNDDHDDDDDHRLSLIECGSANNNAALPIHNNNSNNNSNSNHNSSPSSDLLELFMSPDRCQEFFQYQMQNSLFLPASNIWPSSAAQPTWEILQETTARLLFMAVRWVRCLVPFQTLSRPDQHLLLQV